MSEQQFGWNYFENEVVIRDKQDKKRMIVIVLSNFMDIPYNRKSFDEIVEWLNELSEENEQLRRDNKFLRDEIRLQEKGIFTLFDEVNKLNKENENLKIDHRIMGEKLYIMSKDYIKDVGDDDDLIVFLNELSKEVRRLKKYCNSYKGIISQKNDRIKSLELKNNRLNAKIDFLEKIIDGDL